MKHAKRVRRKVSAGIVKNPSKKPTSPEEYRRWAILRVMDKNRTQFSLDLRGISFFMEPYGVNADAQKIEAALDHLTGDGLAEKSITRGEIPAWRITPEGRRFLDRLEPPKGAMTAPVAKGQTEDRSYSQLYSPFGPVQPKEVVAQPRIFIMETFDRLAKVPFDDAGAQLENFALCISYHPGLVPEYEALAAVSMGLHGLCKLTGVIAKTPELLNPVEMWFTRRLGAGRLTMECLWPILAEAEPMLRSLPDSVKLADSIAAMLKGKSVMEAVDRFVNRL